MQVHSFLNTHLPTMVAIFSAHHHGATSTTLSPTSAAVLYHERSQTVETRAAHMDGVMSTPSYHLDLC